MNLGDEKLYTIKDDITKLIDYSKQIGNSHVKSFLSENRDRGLIKINCDCQKDVCNPLKRKLIEPICTPHLHKESPSISTGNVTVSIVEKSVKSICLIKTEYTTNEREYPAQVL